MFTFVFFVGYSELLDFVSRASLKRMKQGC